MLKEYADNELRRAAARGDSKVVRHLLRAGNDPGDMDNAALRRALKHGHCKIVKMLLASGADISENTAEFLKLAAANKDARSLKMLLRAVKTAIPQTVLNQVLFAAINARNTQAVAVLVAAGANPKADEDRPARVAATAGSVPILEILRRHGADFDAREGEILSNAVNGNHLDATKYILASGVQVNARAHMAVTAAMVLGDSEILEALLDAGGTLQHPYLVTDITARDSVECLLILIRRGCEFHAYAADVAMNAVRHNAPRVLKYVYQHATIPQRARDLELQVAADKSGETILDLLIQHGADPSADDSDSLKRAVKSQKLRFAGKLINAGARIRDLDASAFVATTQAGNWTFLIDLLQRAMPVTGLILSTDQAAIFFRHISPPAFICDTDGDLLPANIRQERNRFAKINGGAAARKSNDEATFVSRWLTDFMIIQQAGA